MTYRTPDSDEILVRRLVKEFAEQAKLINSEASKPGHASSGLFG